jgi:hypothetical protein
MPFTRLRRALARLLGFPSPSLALARAVAAGLAAGLACTPQASYQGPGFPPAQDSCTAGASFTYNSDHTWSATGAGECTKHRKLGQ